MMKVGDRVSQTVTEDGKVYVYQGYVERWVESTAQGVCVRWHKGYASWENEADLELVEKE
jgi:hypothetical protein